MARARKHLICLAKTPYYHVTSRCVRRAFLCGFDNFSGKSFEHRRAWVETRMRLLSSLFSIDIAAYAVMTNHYHLVVRISPDEASGWTDDDVLRRWTTLFKGPLLVKQYLCGESLDAAELATVASIATVYRDRLRSLSWFMKCLNEPIARQANAEDGCTGHFWEARFQSQPLASNQALLAAMAYVDLNPVRAGIATTPEDSEYTSIRTRVSGQDQETRISARISKMLQRGEIHRYELLSLARPLLPFSTNEKIDQRNDACTTCLPIYETEYLRLVDATGRYVIRGKRGWIDPSLEPILDRLRMSTKEWLGASASFRRHYRNGDLAYPRSA